MRKKLRISRFKVNKIQANASISIYLYVLMFMSYAIGFSEFILKIIESHQLNVEHTENDLIHDCIKIIFLYKVIE